MSNQAQAQIEEGKRLLAECEKDHAPKAIGPVGSDLSVAVKALIEWIKTQLAAQTGGGVKKTVLRFIYETALPKLKDYTPTIGDMLIDLAIIAVKSLHDSIPEPNPTV